MSKILVLHSGGLDSTTCLLLARSQGHSVVSLGIDYGQRLRVELTFAEKQCRERQIDRQVVEVKWEKPVRNIPVNRDLASIRSDASPAFLPGRNLIFLSLASAHGSGVGADEVWTGINSIDFSGYPDCTPEFLSAFCKVVEQANPNGPKIRAPLLEMSKPAIASLAHKLGIRKGDTWSCYTPDLADGAVMPCGRCDACRLHDYAWAEAEI
jgi:7-cyano-7-deazaguanine synthase